MYKNEFSRACTSGTGSFAICPSSYVTVLKKESLHSSQFVDALDYVKSPQSWTYSTSSLKWTAKLQQKKPGSNFSGNSIKENIHSSKI